MSGWNGRIGSQFFVYEHTHSQSLNPLKRDDEMPRQVNGKSLTDAWS